MAKSKYIEILEEQYTKKGPKSVISYTAADGKKRYLPTTQDVAGGVVLSEEYNDGQSTLKYRSYDGSYKTIYNSEEIDEKIGDIETLLAEI